MVSTSAGAQDAQSLWQYVSPDKYNLPAVPVSHEARNRLSLLRKLFERDSQEPEPFFKAEDELRTLPQWQIERIIFPPDWHRAAQTLREKLENWLTQDNPEQPVIMLVGPPHSGYIQILKNLAEQLDWSVLSPPSHEQILASDDSQIPLMNDPHGQWVFPSLEKAYLRHATGLNLVRHFLDQAFAGELGHGIIGCGSWAWSYLKHVWHGQQPLILTLQASDDTQLTKHFQGMISSTDTQQIMFRQTDTGNYVLPPPEPDDSSNELSNFLQLLAAHSRGILGIAWDIWRTCLRTEPDDSSADTKEIHKENQKFSHQTIWVAPWYQIKHPSLPAEAGRNEAFVLHTLLLHTGLPFEYLSQLLPLSPNQVAETVSRLKEAGLIAAYDQVLQVSTRGYPLVRQFLNAGGYLIDPF